MNKKTSNNIFDLFLFSVLNSFGKQKEQTPKSEPVETPTPEQIPPAPVTNITVNLSFEPKRKGLFRWIAGLFW